MRRFPVTVGLGLLLVAACSPDNSPTTTPPPDVAAVKAPAGGNNDNQLVVYTQNVYPGANVDAVLASNDPIGALGTALTMFFRTNWAERAADIARFVDQRRPDVISLNEMSTLTVKGLADAFGVPDTKVEFLPILQAALADRGLQYDVAGSVANVDVNIPLGLLDPELPGNAQLRLQDFDVVLTRRGIAVSNESSGNYAAFASVTLFGAVPLELKRGWVSVDLTRGGRTVRFVATHPEPQETSLPLQLAQTSELVSILEDSPYPVIIAGDLNSDPADAADYTSYDQFLDNGFQDAWLSRIDLRSSPGFTCCYDDLTLPASSTNKLVKRIDLVLVRPAGRGAIGPVDFTLFGEQVADQTATDLWPSDHAGVVATLLWNKVDGR